MDFSSSNTRLPLVLSEIGREGASPGECLYAVPVFWLVCGITGVFPEVGVAMGIVEDRCSGEAQCVSVVSSGFETL